VHSDTSEETAQILRERLLRMTPGERVAEGLRASQLAREVMRGGIRARHPSYTPEDVEEALARLLWGDDLYRAAKPGRPLLEP
jgi:hypothetical protein